MDEKKQLKVLFVISVFLIGTLSGVLLLSGVSVNGPVEPSNTQEVNTNGSHITTSSSSDKLKSAINSTVTIYIEKNGKLKSQGSGFFFKENYIMTNAHVILGSMEAKNIFPKKKIYIQYYGGSWSKANVVGLDKYSDIAILDPTTQPKDIKPLTLSGKLPERGQGVIAIGTPLGYTNTISEGIISGTERSMSFKTGGFTIPDTIQTDAPIEPGNSGGPLVLKNSETTVVGINRAKSGTSLGFAISSRLAKRVGTSIIEDGGFTHTYIGFSGRELTPIEEGYKKTSVNNGIVVVNVLPNSPSEGVLKPKPKPDNIEDVIIGIDGKKVSDLEDLSSYLMLNKSPGDKITLKLYNDGNIRMETIILDKRPQYGSVPTTTEK